MAFRFLWFRMSACALSALVPLSCFGPIASGADGSATAVETALQKLKAAYPDQTFTIKGQELVWPDGTRMSGDDGKGRKLPAEWLADPDLEDMLQVPYPAGAEATAPAIDSDPGRARNDAFFKKMYGDCRTGGVTPNLKRITWLKTRAPQTIEVTTINGVADKLSAVSDELEALPKAFDKYLTPIAGTYNCRVIAGTDRASAHGAGIAIDIATRHSNYWRWANGGGKDLIAFKNEIPIEIVRIFEKHGFIWGGRWYHYDTMHFEYRPELLP